MVKVQLKIGLVRGIAWAIPAPVESDDEKGGASKFLNESRVTLVVHRKRGEISYLNMFGIRLPYRPVARMYCKR